MSAYNTTFGVLSSRIIGALCDSAACSRSKYHDCFCQVKKKLKAEASTPKSIGASTPEAAYSSEIEDASQPSRSQN